MFKTVYFVLKCAILRKNTAEILKQNKIMAGSQTIRNDLKRRIRIRKTWRVGSGAGSEHKVLDSKL